MGIKQVAIAPLLLLCFMLVTCDWFEEPEAIEPETEIISCPGGRVFFPEEITIRWIGYAFGGEVAGYDWSIDQSVWSRLPAEITELSLDSLSPGKHIFRVRTVDSRGFVDGSPDSCCFEVILPGFLTQRVVLAEIFTTTWCRNCPNAEKALRELADYFVDSLVVVAYHGTPDRDGLATQETQSRIDWYWNDTGFPGERDQYPTVIFDGLRVVQGAESVEKAKSEYRYEIEERLRVGSPLRIEISGEISDQGGNVEVKVYATDEVDYTGLKLEIVVVEANVKHQGYYSKEFDFVARDLLDVEDIALSAVGDSVKVERSFLIAGGWVPANINVIAFVQEKQSREIIQAAALGR
ncbi:MAG: Omp28-related outer membrane protein [bacterium]